jgi:hypothetical protein
MSGEGFAFTNFPYILSEDTADPQHRPHTPTHTHPWYLPPSLPPSLAPSLPLPLPLPFPLDMHAVPEGLLHLQARHHQDAHNDVSRQPDPVGSVAPGMCKP